ncbi:MAG: PorT family protein [Bacteroides sp.]|nr:PorT family protein [Bacteroides sp.]
MKLKKYICGVVAAMTCLAVSAQSERPGGIEKSALLGLEYEMNAGLNIGGASPLPLPAEIRKIDSYSPHLNLQIGATVTKWFGKNGKWGIASGFRFETKGMETEATVKNYGMEIIQDGKKLSGKWTGKVQTKYHTQQLTIPITAVYKINDRWKVNLGPYLAYAFSNDFDGYVSDGYLREGNPTGNKVTFEGDAEATYDFGDDLRKFQWGIQAGGSWHAFKRLSVNANLTWGLNDIFVKSFKTVSFNMYPIYLNLGFGYIF